MGVGYVYLRPIHGTVPLLFQKSGKFTLRELVPFLYTGTRHFFITLGRLRNTVYKRFYLLSDTRMDLTTQRLLDNTHNVRVVGNKARPA